MDRNAIQQNRDPIGYTKRTRRYPPIKKVEASDECSPAMVNFSKIETIEPLSIYGFQFYV